MAGEVSYILCHFKSGNYFVGPGICYCCFLGICLVEEGYESILETIHDQSVCDVRPSSQHWKLIVLKSGYHIGVPYF